jgi:hypothetical protein
LSLSLMQASRPRSAHRGEKGALGFPLPEQGERLGVRARENCVSQLSPTRREVRYAPGVSTRMPHTLLPKKRPKCSLSPVSRCVAPHSSAAERIGRSFSGRLSSSGMLGSDLLLGKTTSLEARCSRIGKALGLVRAIFLRASSTAWEDVKRITSSSCQRRRRGELFR